MKNDIYSHELRCITSQIFIESLIEILKYYGGEDLKISHDHFFPDESYFQTITPIVEQLDQFIRETIEAIDWKNITPLEEKLVSSYVVLSLANPILCKRNAFDEDNAALLLKKFGLSKKQIGIETKNLMETIFDIYTDEEFGAQIDELLADL